VGKRDGMDQRLVPLDQNSKPVAAARQDLPDDLLIRILDGKRHIRLSPSTL